MGLIYFQRLYWTFTSETIAILFVESVMLCYAWKSVHRLFDGTSSRSTSTVPVLLSSELPYACGLSTVRILRASSVSDFPGYRRCAQLDRALKERTQRGGAFGFVFYITGVALPHPRRRCGFSVMAFVPRYLHAGNGAVAFRPTTRSRPRLGSRHWI